MCSEFHNKFLGEIITRENLTNMLYYIKNYDREHNLNRNFLIMAIGNNVSIHESPYDCIIINDRITYKNIKEVR